MTMPGTTGRRIALLLAVAGALAACAEEREPINRVQPYALPKSFFIGEDFQSANDDPEFWTQNTLIDVGYGAAQDGLFTSTYAQPMTRLKWQIEQDVLIGRAAYERIEGSDGKGVATGDETENGNVVVMFAVTSQFDIVNAYNSTTGEKLNIVEENDYDRPWNEREYIRVDFSKNLMTDNFDFDTASLIGVYGAISYEPISYYVSDPQDEQAPVFDLDNGYFDVTTKMWAQPGFIDMSDLGWGIDEYPACFLDADFRGGSFPSGNCNPVELTLRQSFRRVENHDLVPMDNDGWRFKAFGAFAFAERRGFDRKYGILDEELHRFQSQFPLFERSHYYQDPENMTGAVECYTPNSTPAGADVHRDLDGNGTEDECEAVTQATGVGGSKCDEFSQKCTLPYRLRTVKPMPWYVTNGSDLRFFEPTEYATHQWDAALRSAVATARYTECIAVETGAATDAAGLETAKAKCLAENPVYFGQAEANEDLIFLSQEMDDCRHGAVAGFGVTGAVGSDEREAACASVVDGKGAAIGAEAGVIYQAKMPEVVTLCHSPVQIDDPPMCGTAEQRLGLNPLTNEQLTAEVCNGARAAGERDVVAACQEALNVRIGDLRYHQVNLIETPQTPSPWGIMVSSIDPLNGETVANSVNIWTYVNELWAQRAVDWMRFAAGELSAEDVTEGENIKDWAATAKAAAEGGAFPGMTKAERQRRIATTLGVSTEELESLQTGTAAHQVAAGLAKQLGTIRASADVAGEKAATYRARMKAVSGTELEASLMNTAMQQLSGVEGIALTDGVLDLASPLRGGNASIQTEIERLKQNALGERGMCELEMADAPVSITGLSAVLQEKFGAFDAASDTGAQQDRADRMATYLEKWAHASVIAHEMGHAVGLRHNFVSSSDAWSFTPQYWALRTKNGAVTNLCKDLDATGEACVGPRYFDPITPNESENLVWMWEFSSIMDYAGETTQDLLPIGAYDFAAARFFYGDSAPVYGADYISGDHAADRLAMIGNKLDNFGGLLGFTYDDADNANVHYSQLPEYLDLIPSCDPVDPSLYEPTRWNDQADGAWSPLLDGHIVSVDGQPTRCKTQPVDYTRWTELQVPADCDADGDGAQDNWYNATDGTCDLGWVVDKFGRYRVPYGFATDRWADIGNAAVYRHDNGADTYEIFNFLASQQELFSVFDNYRRGRSTFTISGSVNRTMERYLGKMRDGAKGVAFIKNIVSNSALGANFSPERLWAELGSQWFGDGIVAATLAFDHFTRNAQRPAPILHGVPLMEGIDDVIRANDGDGLCGTLFVGQPSTCTDAGIVPNGAYAAEGGANGFKTLSPGGKVVENQLLDDQGEYDSEFTKTAGSYYDKMYMSMMLTESVDNFISDSRSDFVDKRYRSCSLADLYPDGYRRWLANNLTNDDFVKGPRIAVGSNGVPAKDADGLWTTGIGWTQWWGDEVRSCFPEDGTNVCSAYDEEGTPVELVGAAPENVMPVDPQLSWEVQKFLITWTYIYLPENQKANWIDQMRMHAAEVLDDDANLDDMIAFYDPDGYTYLAKRYGKEQIFGETVEKGVAARVLQYANELLNKAYVTTEVDYDGDGVTDWYEPVKGEDGEYQVKFDPTTYTEFNWSASGWDDVFQYTDDCDEDDISGCTCEMNRFCIELRDYISVLKWMAAWSGFADYDTSDWNDTIGITG